MDLWIVRMATHTEVEFLSTVFQQTTIGNHCLSCASVRAICVLICLTRVKVGVQLLCDSNS